MTIDEVCQMTKSPSMLNALHACRHGHPWNVQGINHWFNAYFLALQHREINATACSWLLKMSKI